LVLPGDRGVALRVPEEGSEGLFGSFGLKLGGIIGGGGFLSSRSFEFKVGAIVLSAAVSNPWALGLVALVGGVFVKMGAVAAAVDIASALRAKPIFPLHCK
jgi:hypothetical protein